MFHRTEVAVYGLQPTQAVPVYGTLPVLNMDLFMPRNDALMS